MQLKDVPRQIVSGVAAAVAFLGAYFGLTLTWWAALGVGGAAYAALLLIISRQKEDNEVDVGGGISRADVQNAIKVCRGAAEKLFALSKTKGLSPEMAGLFARLAELTEQIGKNYETDPQDLRPSWGFTDHHIGKILELADGYVHLSSAALTDQSRVCLGQLRCSLLEFKPQVEAIYDACLKNDFDRLSVETAALEQIMRIEAPAALKVRR